MVSGRSEGRELDSVVEDRCVHRRRDIRMGRAQAEVCKTCGLKD